MSSQSAGLVRFPNTQSTPIQKRVEINELTATFFWDRTTAQSFPRTPMEVMLAEVMALKAYSKAQKVG